MNYIPSERGTPNGLVIGAAVLVLGSAAYVLLAGDGHEFPSSAAITTPVPSATPAVGASLPLVTATATTPLQPGGRYEVVDGDSAWLIAEKLAVPLTNRDAWIVELLALNGVDELELQIGQTLILPPFEPLSGGGAGSNTTTTETSTEDTEDGEAVEEAGDGEEAASETASEDTEEAEVAETDGEDDDGGDGRDNRDDDDDDGPVDLPGLSLDVDGGNIGACATIDEITYCAGSGGTWNCDTSGDSIRCTGPAGQSTTCSGGDNSISCEGPSGETTTCTDTGSSTSCSSTNIDVTSDSQSQNCAVIGSATICFGGNSDDD
jgi:hypothetical protein